METPQDVFDHTEQMLAAEPARIAGLTALYQFDIDGQDGGSWTLEVVDGRAKVRTGAPPEPDVVILMESEDFLALSTGRLNGQEAFMDGRLRVLGNAGLGIRLATILG